MLRPVSIAHFLAVLVAKGHAAAALLAGTGIDPVLLESPDYFISAASQQHFLENMIRLTGDNGIGLQLGQSVEVTHYGILAYTGFSSQSIRAGIETVWRRYGTAFGFATTLSMRTDAACDIITFEAPLLSEPVYRFQMEEALCALMKIGGAMAGALPEVMRLTLTYPRPSYAATYETIFHCAPVFGAPSNSLAVKHGWLDQKLRTTDIELNRAGRDYLDRVLVSATAAESPVSRLRQYLLAHLSQAPTLQEAAKEFGISPRTLARQLTAENCSYRQIIDELRSRLARQWLRAGQMEAKEASFRLGFQDVPAFRRAFKTWTGQTISAWSKAARAPSDQS